MHGSQCTVFFPPPRCIHGLQYTSTQSCEDGRARASLLRLTEAARGVDAEEYESADAELDKMMYRR